MIINNNLNYTSYSNININKILICQGFHKNLLKIITSYLLKMEILSNLNIFVTYSFAFFKVYGEKLY